MIYRPGVPGVELASPTDNTSGVFKPLDPSEDELEFLECCCLAFAISVFGRPFELLLESGGLSGLFKNSNNSSSWSFFLGFVEPPLLCVLENDDRLTCDKYASGECNLFKFDGTLIELLSELVESLGILPPT